MADDDAVEADEDLADDGAQHALAILDAGAVRSLVVAGQMGMTLCPRRQVRRGWEPGHVRAGLGDDDLGGALGYPGDGAEPGDDVVPGTGERPAASCANCSITSATLTTLSPNQLRVVGRTTALTPAQLAALLTPPAGSICGPSGCPLAGLAAFPEGRRSTVRVEPRVVVEVRVDVAAERGRWRHALRYLRSQPDLTPADVPLDLNLQP